MEDLFIASRMKSGDWTWTVTTRLLLFLEELEDLFGPRCVKYLYGGVEFADDGPYVWYPFGKYVVVRLSSPCVNEPARALFQLAHESVHLIAPLGSREGVTVLEEALASWFQLKIVAEHSQLFAEDWKVLPPRYASAAALITPLLCENPQAIKRIRVRQPNFHDISMELLKEEFVNAPDEVLRQLTSPFSVWAEGQQ